MDKNAEIPPLETVLKIMDDLIAYEESDVAKEVAADVARLKAMAKTVKNVAP
jgi:hypothetical protein